MNPKERLDEFISKIENTAIRVEDCTSNGGPFYQDVNGFKFNYITFCSNGIKKEGASIKTYKTEDDAVNKFCSKLHRLLAVNMFEYVLVWRMRPGIKGNINDGFTVICRLQTV